MEPTAILAHRGHWLDPAEKNAMVAFRRAIDGGYGIETDLRDLDGELVISHDPPRRSTRITATEFFHACGFDSGQLALNVKADGLQQLTLDVLAEADVQPSRVFVFDMAVPDALRWLDTPVPAFTRVSELETEPSFVDQAAGVWVDDFTGRFPQLDHCRIWLDRGLRVTLVSPELHGRPHLPVWEAARVAGMAEHPDFSICTDLPDDAHTFFGIAS